ncbi:30S ribosomal protein S2 [candidate division WWE3 bacterium RIFCSPHIGHO2_01_FULL_42_13]|uniref:Small ribosomal subunit protein uS2 n=1 Tax=candidate division WWE3 bacterium RIFCSPHIGHO2_01_FULL_42_13 TaxID=1802617 RepID=A0A1F4UTM3_UNCKA|nr:MAG: 30S ribosomal protein S2 [candidate division WWE3 bacterium RIFCSPHIGHO2_01_FULL_42_13]
MPKYKLPKAEELFEAGVHFGHQVRRWHPAMEKYIFAQRSGIHIVDLDKTVEGLKAATQFLYETAAKGGQIIFVGTKRQAAEIIATEAKRAGALFVNDRWLGGTVTNFRIVRKNIDKLVDFINKRQTGQFDKYTKKERLLLDREIDKLQISVGGIVGLQGKPAALFIIDTRREKTAINEARITGIPVVAIVDTNSDPRNINYLIPGNDDAIRSISTIVKPVADAVAEGYAEYAEKSAKEKKERDEAKEAAKQKAVEEAVAQAEAVKVTSSESPHATEVAGKKLVEKPEKLISPLETEIIEEKVKKDIKDEVKEKKTRGKVKVKPKLKK